MLKTKDKRHKRKTISDKAVYKGRMSFYLKT